MATTNARMRQRRGTAAAWTGANPTLSAGEIGYEQDTGRTKIGDGGTVWTSLEYINPKDEFSAYEVSAGAGFTGTAVTLPIGSEHFSSSSNYTLASDEVTIATAGRYHITADFAFEISSGSGSNEVQAWLEIDTVEVAGTRSLVSVREGATGTITLILDIAASEVLRIRAIRTVGTATLATVANGVRLTMELIF